MSIIDGKLIASQIRQEIKQEIANLEKKYHTRPGLAVILIGDDPASKIYVRNKEKACQEVGIDSEEYLLSSEIPQRELFQLIDELNKKPNIQGILVQLPLPKGFDKEEILSRISPAKDVDGFNPVNLGRLFAGSPRFIPCTPLGIMELLNRQGVGVDGKQAVVIGRSLLVGRPTAWLLIQKHATVTICHTHTKNLAQLTRQADIVIAACGRPGLIKAEMIKEGAVVIDVGINRVPDPSSEKGYRLKGDVVFEEVVKKASLITPVPGGVGPMTIAMLLKNTLKAYKAFYSHKITQKKV